VRCFEPGWEDGGKNRNPPVSDEELSKHFYTKVEVRFRLGGFNPVGCGKERRWNSSTCDVYPGRFLSALTGPWMGWPSVGNPMEMQDLNENQFKDAACNSVKGVTPGTTK
jgi:hypothetical protein